MCIQQRYLHNCQLTKANADNEAIHNAFRNDWLSNRNLWVVGRSIFDILDKYECWTWKCVKSVLGEFSSGVSICRKDILSQIWGPIFTWAPIRGNVGPSSGIQKLLDEMMKG